MSSHNNDDILDDVFHGCAWAAYLDQAHTEQGPPGAEATRQRAFRYYEEALAEKNGRPRLNDIPATQPQVGPRLPPTLAAANSITAANPSIRPKAPATASGIVRQPPARRAG